VSSAKRTFVACLVFFLGVAFVSASFACSTNMKPTGIYGGRTGQRHQTGHGVAGTEGRNFKRGFIVEENPVSKLRPDLSLANTYPDADARIHESVVSLESRFVPLKTFSSSFSPVLNI